MTMAEKVELMLIPIMATLIWLMAPIFPNNLPAGRLLLLASALVLLQSLVRDLWLLFNNRRGEQKPSKAARCICIESAVGATGVVVGAILLGAEINHPMFMNEWAWSALIVVVLSGGFLMKDYVMEWSPWRIRRDKDHMNIVFRWKT
jgi:hypothetical protein